MDSLFWRDSKVYMADLEMIEQLSSCRKIDELYTSTARIVRQMGFEHFLYAVRVHTSLTGPYQFILSGYPEEWCKHYFEARYEKIDPIVDHFLISKRTIPMLWDDSVFESEAAARLWREAGEFGLASGASFGVRGRNGEAALLSLATSRKPGPAISDTVEAMGIAQPLTCYLHEAIARIVLSKQVIPVERDLHQSLVFLEDYRGKSKTYSVVPSHSISAAINRTISFFEKQVQRKFKHAVDFGITGNYSQANATKFQQVLEAHVSDPATQIIQGIYHRQNVTYFFNPNAGLSVIRGTDGAFISGWRLSLDQVIYLSRSMVQTGVTLYVSADSLKVLKLNN